MIKLPGIPSSTGSTIVSRTSFIYRTKPLKSSVVDGFTLFKYIDAIKFRICCGEGMAPFPTFPLEKAVVSGLWGWLGLTGATALSLIITPWDSCGCPIITDAPCRRLGPEMAPQSIFNLRGANKNKSSLSNRMWTFKIWLIVTYPSTCVSFHI